MGIAEQVVLYIRVFLYAVWLKYGVSFDLLSQYQSGEQNNSIQISYATVIVLFVLIIVIVAGLFVLFVIVFAPIRHQHITSFFGNLIITTDTRDILIRQHDSGLHDSGLLRIFLCYSSLDKSRAKNLFQNLRLDRFDPWLDEEKLVAGQDWSLEVAKAIRTSDVVLVLLSLQSVRRTGYMQKEIRITLDLSLEKPEDKIFIIPVRLEECEVPESLKKWHWVNLFEPTGYHKLKSALEKLASAPE